jgi:hypothetical protein
MLIKLRVEGVLGFVGVPVDSPLGKKSQAPKTSFPS